jgi:two-component system sensor histidine kinase AlgZ
VAARGPEIVARWPLMQSALFALKALAEPRRAVPLALLGAMLVLVEAWVAREFSVVAFTSVLYTAFVILGPLSWCTVGHRPLGRVIHGLNGVACTYLFGVLLRDAWIGENTLLTDTTGLVSITGGFWVGGHSVGRDIQLESALSVARADAEARKREAEHAQLLALRAHFDPHFLFNTLNAIAEWCREAPEVAEQATLRLSQMLRAILEAVKHVSWPLSRELALVEDLFALYATRDPQRFVFQARVEEAARGVEVPPLLLLTLAENAIKHGPAAGHRGAVTLDVTLSGSGELRMRFTNHGEYRSPRPGGEGLSLVQRRVDHVYRGDGRFTIQGHDGITVAELHLPSHGAQHA